MVARRDICLSIQFVTGIIDELEADGRAIFKRNLKSDYHNVANFKLNTLNKEQQTYEQIKHEVQTKIGRKNQIEHYFNVVDRQLQCVMKKKMFVHIFVIAKRINLVYIYQGLKTLL